MVQYRIEWVSYYTNYKSNGEWHELKDKELLDDMIKYANDKYKGGFNHWLGSR
tara:strand:+ start:555 stop:713 length:159 start_codon:yes stop_codon:yes gene_type:complete